MWSNRDRPFYKSPLSENIQKWVAIFDIGSPTDSNAVQEFNIFNNRFKIEPCFMIIYYEVSEDVKSLEEVLGNLLKIVTQLNTVNDSVVNADERARGKPKLERTYYIFVSGNFIKMDSQSYTQILDEVAKKKTSRFSSLL